MKTPIQTIKACQEILWPDGNKDQEWNAGHLEDIARLLDAPTTMGVTLDNFGHLRPCDDEAVLLGTVYVFGTPYHFFFVEVKVKAGGEWEAVNDPYDRLEDAQRLDSDGALLATEIDGKLYIGFAHPHAD